MSGLIGIAGLALAFGHLAPASTIQITGAVKHPGPVVLQGPTTLRQAIESSAGFLPVADLKAIKVRRQDGVTVTYDLLALGPIPSAHAGDLVEVPSLDPSTVVFLGGAVKNRAPLAFRPGMTLADALAEIQPAMTKELDRVTLTRKGADGKESRTNYPAKNLSMVAPTVALAAGDSVSLPYARAYTMNDRELVMVLVIALVVIAIGK